MNPLMQMNRALEYLEENLLEEIDFERMARIAGCSEYHFRRVFSYLAGMSLGDYLRYRRLAEAGTLLRQGCKVIDCAVILGYNSPDAFRTAFQRMHGVSPSKARRPDVALKVFPPMTFQLTIKGGAKMEYRIIHNRSFHIVGFKKRITLQFEGENAQMASLYEKLTPECIAQLKALCDIQPKGMLSVSANFADRTQEGTELDQYIGIATTKAPPSGYDVLPVDESDWAVFSVSGPFPKAMQDTWARIYAEWLPACEYQLTGGPELVWHESADMAKPGYKSEI